MPSLGNHLQILNTNYFIRKEVGMKLRFCFHIVNDSMQVDSAVWCVSPSHYCFYPSQWIHCDCLLHPYPSKQLSWFFFRLGYSKYVCQTRCNILNLILNMHQTENWSSESGINIKQYWCISELFQPNVSGQKQ